MEDIKNVTLSPTSTCAVCPAGVMLRGMAMDPRCLAYHTAFYTPPLRVNIPHLRLI